MSSVPSGPPPGAPRSGSPGLRWLITGLSLLALAAVGVTSFLIGGHTPTDRDLTVTLEADRPIRVLFVGDSISYGLNAKLTDLGFRPQMVDALAIGGPVEEFHTNRSGATTRAMSRLLNVPERLDLAVVELGTNDVAEKTPLPEFTRSYRALLERVHTESPGVPLLCVGTWGSAGGTDGSDAYNAIIEHECARQDGAFAGLYGLYPDPQNRGPAGRAVVGGTSDTFHPNDTGYRAIATLLLGRIDVDRASVRSD